MHEKEYATFRRKLNRWYGDRARDLPWRATADPYRIWISEIMLQQTTVEAVIPYFQRFLQRFPSVEYLANADESEVLRLWEGLGYYSRARNLLRTAKLIVEQYAGAFPSDLDTLQSLPGIGRYTAGAIASFAFDQRAPIVEANTLRLYCRLLGYSEDPRSREGQGVLWNFAEAILPKAGTGQINQALMELGATVCAPRDPDCAVCPVHLHCAAFREGSQATVPRPKARIAITDVREVSIAIRKGNDYLLRKRTQQERWAGLWDFIRFEVDRDRHPTDDLGLSAAILVRTGLSVEMGREIVELKHGVTRYRITLNCFTARRIKGKLKPDEEWQWVHPTRFNEYPLSVTARQFAERLKSL